MTTLPCAFISAHCDAFIPPNSKYATGAGILDITVTTVLGFAPSAVDIVLYKSNFTTHHHWYLLKSVLHKPFQEQQLELACLFLLNLMLQHL
jgi:hypothetical protein